MFVSLFCTILVNYIWLLSSKVVKLFASQKCRNFAIWYPREPPSKNTREKSIRSKSLRISWVWEASQKRARKILLKKDQLNGWINKGYRDGTKFEDVNYIEPITEEMKALWDLQEQLEEKKRNK